MREYHPSELALEDLNYLEAATGQKLILFEDVLRGHYRGLPDGSDELERLREELLQTLEGRLPPRDKLDRRGLLAATANTFYQAFSQASRGEWPSLPADTRRGANRSTLADHSLLTSAIATGLIQEALSRGKAPDVVVRASPPLTPEELFHLTRIAALSHDLGKLPPSKHRERGRQAVARLLGPRLSQELVEAVADVALRHHDARYYREAGQGPLGFFEEAICHADTASGVDRVSELFPEHWTKRFEEIAQLQGKHGFLRYPTSGEAILTLLSRMKDWEEEAFGASPPLSLILADVDRVKGYVFESARLPEVRGASRILDQLNREGIEERLAHEGVLYQGQRYPLAPEAILYAAGGGALILAPACLAETIATALEQLYLERTGWATISIASYPLHLFELPYGFAPYQSWFDRLRPRWEGAQEAERAALEAYLSPLSPEEAQGIQDGTTALFQRFLKTKRFGEITSHLNYRLKRAKEEREEVPVPALTPFARLCSSCQTRPATHLELQPQELSLCEVCRDKREVGARRSQDPNRGKGFFVNGFLRYLQDSQEEGCRRYREAMDQRGGERRIEVASDLASLGNCAIGRAQGYVGVLYADGNDIGRQLEQISTPAEYRLFARTLRETVEACVFHGLAEHLEPRKTQDQQGQEDLIHPFEIVTIGGDDLFLIVPADRALRIALSICRRFEEEFQAGKRLTLSAGVVIARAHSPIYLLQRLAEQLLKSAKKQARKQARGQERSSWGGTIDFLILTSEGASDLEELRRKLYQVEGALEELHLTERPLALGELEGLLKAAARLRSEFPRSQLYAIRQSLSRGRPFGRNFLFYQLGRMKGDGQQAFKEAMADWWGAEWSDDPHFPFHRKENNEWTTPFADLVEVMDFIGEEGRTEP